MSFRHGGEPLPAEEHEAPTDAMLRSAGVQILSIVVRVAVDLESSDPWI